VRWTLVALAACHPPPARPAENRAAPDSTAPRSACPRLSSIESETWQGIAFPQCAPEPFETELPICGGRRCPRPCRITFVNQGSVSTIDVRYDSAGRWLASKPSNPNELSREASYDGDVMRSCHTNNGYVDVIENMTYDHGRLVAISSDRDGDVHLAYDGDVVVGLTHASDALHFAYDAAGRLVAVTGGRTVSYHYDDDGFVVGLDEDYEHARFRYDGGRLVRTHSDLSGGDAVASDLAITYDGSGRVARIATDMLIDKVYRSTTTYDYCD
jgi:YD repeat-containing protein